MYPHHVFNLEPAGTFGMYPICYRWVSGGYFQPEPAMYSRCFHWFPGPLVPSAKRSQHLYNRFTIWHRIFLQSEPTANCERGLSNKVVKGFLKLLISDLKYPLRCARGNYASLHMVTHQRTSDQSGWRSSRVCPSSEQMDPEGGEEKTI